MRRIRIIEHVSLDGVMQQSVDDDGFPHSDWTVPYRTPVGRDAVFAAFGERFDLLLGRRTYDLWSAFWPTAPSSPMTSALNAATKFVATHRAESLTWGPYEHLGPDLAEGVRRIRDQNGPDLIVSGSSTLVPTLINLDVADEIVLAVYPVLLGAGKRLFAECGSARKFELISTMTTPTGVLLNTYKLLGSPAVV